MSYTRGAHTRGESRDSQDSTQSATGAHPALDGRPESLEPFVGRWHMEGQQLVGPTGAAAPISALQTYEWLPGELVLVHRFDGHIGDSAAACVETISFDTERRCYRAHTFYNNGQMNVWDITYRDDHWLMVGDWNADGRALKVRCTITFADDGQTMNSKWEHSRDRSKWQTFWDVSARKITDH
jgi:hypothetical protein